MYDIESVQEKFEIEHRQFISKTLAKIEQMRDQWNKTYTDPMMQLVIELTDFERSIGISSQPPDLPDFDDKDFEAKFKVIEARMAKAYAEHEQEIKAYEGEIDKIRSASESGMLQIEKEEAELKLYIKAKLAHAGELCPYCKGRGKISSISDEKRKTYEGLVARLNG